MRSDAIRIVGGPSPRDVKFFDAESGEEIVAVLRADIRMRPDELTTVALTTLAEVDMAAEATLGIDGRDLLGRIAEVEALVRPAGGYLELTPERPDGWSVVLRDRAGSVLADGEAHGLGDALANALVDARRKGTAAS